MKGDFVLRILVSIFVGILLVMPANAAGWSVYDRVPKVGTVILKKNSLPPSINFVVVNGTPDNKYAIPANSVQIKSFDLLYAVNDDEVAYILSHELGEVIAQNIPQKNKNCSSLDIDAMGIDLMINSGYNPLAGIALLGKLSRSSAENETEKSVFFERMSNLYDYLSYNYPSKLLLSYDSKSYRAFLMDYSSVIYERKANSKVQASFNRAQAKISSKRLKMISKYDYAQSKLLDWNVYPELLKSITEPEEK